MGSSPSPAKSGLVYRNHGRRLLRKKDPWALWGVADAKKFGVPLHQLISIVRIADDDIAMSSILCVACTAKLGAQVYPAPLVHSSEEGGTCVKVIDVCVEMCGARYTITGLNRTQILS